LDKGNTNPFTNAYKRLNPYGNESNYDDKEGKRRYITEIIVNDLVMLGKAG